MRHDAGPAGAQIALGVRKLFQDLTWRHPDLPLVITGVEITWYGTSWLSILHCMQAGAFRFGSSIQIRELHGCTTFIPRR